MTPAQSNRYLLDFWAGAYANLGEAALPPLGLSPADIDAVLTVEPAMLRLWADRQASIVRPRPGLLPALQTQDQSRIETFLTAGCSGHSELLTVYFLPSANQHLLALWRQASGDAEAAERMALSNADRVALTAANKRSLDRWGQLPIMLAEPRPGLLPDLLARYEPALAAFLDSLGPMDPPR